MRRTIQFHGITFSRYAGLDVDFIDVQNDGDIDKMKFDIFVNRALSADGDGQIIADVGGNIYIPLLDYFRNNEVLQLFLAKKVEMLLHIPIVGAGDLFPTLKTLDELMRSTPEEVQAAVWKRINSLVVDLHRLRRGNPP